MQSRIKDDVEHECYLCGKQGKMQTHHIFGGSKRARCDELRLVVHLCLDCHTTVHEYKGRNMMKYLHEKGQKLYEEEIGTREEFIKDFIVSYL